MFEIGEFGGSDEAYEAIAALYTAVWPENPVTAESLKAHDTSLDPNYLSWRDVVVQARQIVAWGTLSQWPWAFHPRKYWVDFCVHPAYEGQGIGTAYLNHLLALIAPHNPLTLTCETRASKPQTIHFLKKHGFVEVMRFLYCVLDVASFDASQFQAVIDRVQTAAIEIISVSELQAREPNNWQHILYDLHWQLTQDVPATIQRTRPTFALFATRVFEDTGFLPGGWQVAMANGRYVGLTILRHKGNRDKLFTGLTGVVRSYRRLGIATALKVRSILYAQQIGAQTIQADNEANNPMYLLNQKLGFQPLPAGIMFSKIFASE